MSRYFFTLEISLTFFANEILVMNKKDIRNKRIMNIVSHFKDTGFLTPINR